MRKLSGLALKTTPKRTTCGYTNGKVSSVTSGSETILSGVLYDPFGPIRAWTWGNASQMVRTYDLDGNLDQLDSGGLRTYAQDDAFRITGITDTVDASNSWNYGYDLLDRLTAASRTGLTQGWSYDANGNRLSQTGTAPSTYTMAGTSNRLNGVSGALSRSYGYDAAGNATADGSASFGYDGAGRLTSASKSGISASYALNALGQRVRKTVNGVATIFSYDESGHLLGEYEASGALIREYVWLGDIPVAVITGGPGTPPYVFWYLHADHLDTPRAVENPTSGDLVWRWDAAPFGETAPNEDPDGDFNPFTLPLRFPGQYADSETGLHYNYFRDYEPAIGRYVQSDPIGIDGGVNAYAFVEDSPIEKSDSRGLKVEVRCRRVGDPNKPTLLGNLAAMLEGEHCYVVVSCDSPKQIPETTISYPRSAVPTDILYSTAEYYRTLRVFPPASEWKNGEPCPTCEFEQCILDTYTRLRDSGYRMTNYDKLGPNSVSFARRIVEKCGGSIWGVGPRYGWDDASRVGF